MTPDEPTNDPTQPPTDPTTAPVGAPPTEPPAGSWSDTSVPPPPGAPQGYEGYGAPQGYDGYGAPGYPPVPPAAPEKRRRLPIPGWLIGILVVALIGGVGYFMSRRPLDAPAQLAGLKQSTDAELVKAAEEAQKDVKDNLGGKSTIGAFYGDKSNAVLLVAGRDKMNLDKEWKDIEKESGGQALQRQKVNGVECAVNGGLTMCLWSDGVSGVVLDLRPGTTIEQAAAVTREAKDALN